MIEITVICDHGDCPETIEFNGPGVLPGAKRKLTEAGWKNNLYVQYCPKHKEWNQ